MDQKSASDFESESQPESPPVYVTFVSGDTVITEIYSTAEAWKKGILESEAYNLTEEREITSSPARGVVCPDCGFSEGDFEKQGRLGCPRCYEAFNHLIPNILKNVHPGEFHVGKSPVLNISEAMKKNRLRYLESALDRAIRKEQFEEAASMRDQIRELQAGLDTDPE